MRIIFISFLASVVLGCGYDSRKDEILGVWISDKELTLESISKGKPLPLNLKEFMDSNVGTMAYVFMKEESTFTDARTLNEDQLYLAWSLVSIDNVFIQIKYTPSFMSSSVVTFTRKDNCIGLNNNEYDLTEYFCRNS